MASSTFRPAGAIALLSAVLLGALAGSSVTPAEAYPDSVIRKCRGDYNRLCPGYKLHTDELRACMRSKHRAITDVCMNALVDAGEAPRTAYRR